MNAARKYCKEISNNFDAIAVYLPGSRIMAGDIISFKKELFSTNPNGIFVHESSLNKLGIKYSTRKNSSSNDLSYLSKGGIVLSTNVKAPDIIETSIDFKSANSTYFNAIGCKEESIEDFSEIKKQIHLRCNNEFNNLYIVTRIIKASKAIIMQSSSGSAKLKFETTIDPTLGTNLDLRINTYQGQDFIINANNGATVLMDLYKIKITQPQRTAATIDLAPSMVLHRRLGALSTALIPRRNIDVNARASINHASINAIGEHSSSSKKVKVSIYRSSAKSFY